MPGEQAFFLNWVALHFEEATSELRLDMKI